MLQSRYSEVLNNSSKNFALNFNTLKFNISSIKTPILRLVLFLSKVIFFINILGESCLTIGLLKFDIWLVSVNCCKEALVELNWQKYLKDDHED